MDELDRKIVNALQRDFPICDHPFATVAADLGTTELDLLSRLQKLRDENILTRFGPLYNADRFGGAVSLCAMAVPNDDFDEVAEKVNAYSQVAHNYERGHTLNMWFVLATETQDELLETLTHIETDTGLTVRNMPKLQEFYVGLHFEV
ncbi:MAG: Lrp/AsnC family transcriptional regulator [Gammaproteobacteria bacterium]|jgi:siroheme decarboxylase|nr:Lrp/AsnC family transcriptional regulator [Gammaproteobacteria bacterium]MBT4494483.1 Lrp/AsnC family transcriptional regulator [Gammaproteobacteria bacterium]MBT7371856.1 Lrp/AsnC family transcriptional regulator [Gammaproteobacteria bacterium]